MTPQTADAALFGEALGCEQHRPAAFVTARLDDVAVQQACLRAEAFLQSVAMVEDNRSEESDDHSATALALQRIEARLDLLTLLVARMAGRDGDAACTVRWSAAGARISGVGDCAEDDRGLFRIQPCDWLPESLELPARVLAADAAQAVAWLRFEPLSPGLVLALERHLFRVHRREVALRRGHRTVSGH